MSWIKTFTEALNQSLKTKLDKKEAFGIFAKKTELFSRDYKDLKNKPNYAVVARTGSYKDLVDKIPYATVGASLYEDQLKYEDNSYNSTPINTSLSFVVKKEEDPYLGYGSSYYTIFRDSEGLVTLAMQPRNNMNLAYFPTSRTLHVNDPEGHTISSYSGFNVINGKLYIYEGYPNYGLFIADLNNKYNDDNVWKVDAEYISLPDSLYKEAYGRLSKVPIEAVEYCDGYYYVYLNKSRTHPTYTTGDVIVYKTSDFITFTETPIEVVDPIGGYSVEYALKMWGNKLVVMPNRSATPFYVLDSEHDEWVEIPNMSDDPAIFGNIKYSLYNETLDIVTVFFNTDAFVCDASKLLDADAFSWTKLRQPYERDFKSTIFYMDHIVPDAYNDLDKPVSVIGTYYEYYYSYDGYTWHAVSLTDYCGVCFVNVYHGNFLIYAFHKGEDNVRCVRLSNGLSIADTYYDSYKDVTHELSLAVRNEIGFLEPPPFDGTYNLKCTVVDGVPTYTWEEDIPYIDEAELSTALNEVFPDDGGDSE